ncbi:MAG: hypothetical protein ACPH3C_07850 [Glaciecola sp.]
MDDIAEPVVISEHLTQHVYFSRMIEQRCNIEIPIVMKSKFKVFEDGTGQAAGYEPECPSWVNVSWSIPASRSDGSLLSIDEISGYEITIRVNNPAATRLVIDGDVSCISMKTIDTAGLESESTDFECVK